MPMMMVSCVLSNDLIEKWYVCGVCFYILISVEIGRPLLKSILPYIWANLEIKSIIEIKGLNYQKACYLILPANLEF